MKRVSKKDVYHIMSKQNKEAKYEELVKLSDRVDIDFTFQLNNLFELMKQPTKSEIKRGLIEAGNKIGIEEFVRIMCKLFDANSCAELLDAIDELYPDVEDESEIGDEY